MPATPVKWYFDVTSKRMVGGLNGPFPLPPPPLHQEDSLALDLMIVTRRSYVAAPLFSPFNIAGYGLFISIGSAATVLASQNVFTINSDNNTFSGTLDLNTAGINALADGAEKTLEIRLFNGTVYYRGQEFVTIKKSVALAAALAVAAEDTALGKKEAQQTYVPFTLPAGRGLEFVSEDGTKKGILYLGNDGTFRIPGLT